MGDCDKSEETAVNCTETTEVPNTPSQNTDKDQSEIVSHPSHAGETQRNGNSGGLNQSTAPWSADGLSFECSQCGDCCSGAPGAVWVTDEELTAIALALGKPLGEVRLLHTKLLGGRWSLRDYPNRDCVFLDPQSHRSQVDSARPSQCWTWPFLPSNIETKEAWERTCDHCPGAGGLHTLEVIHSQAAACEISVRTDLPIRSHRSVKIVRRGNLCGFFQFY